MIRIKSTGFNRRVVLLRNVRDNVQTLGNLLVYDQHGKLLFSCKSLERPWEDNQRNVSCVPSGRYELVFEWSNRFQQNLWELKGVPNRSECKIHSANFWFQLNGCIATGDMHVHINDDGAKDVRNSKDRLRAFHRAMHPETKAIIDVIDL